MALPFPQYSRIKDNYCISYCGSCTEYIIQLLYLRPAIEQELPGIKIYIMCKDELSHITTGHKRIICASKSSGLQKNIAYLRELKCNMIDHPILSLLNESNLTLEHLEKSIPESITLKCAICPNGNAPTKSIDGNMVARLEKMALSKGYMPVLNDVENAGWVIGVENELLFSAAVKGVKTSLVATGLGTDLYKKMFPYSEIISPEHI